jgi:hypothetical protein
MKNFRNKKNRAALSGRPVIPFNSAIIYAESPVLEVNSANQLNDAATRILCRVDVRVCSVRRRATHLAEALGSSADRAR